VSNPDVSLRPGILERLFTAGRLQGLYGRSIQSRIGIENYRAGQKWTTAVWLWNFFNNVPNLSALVPCCRREHWAISRAESGNQGGNLCELEQLFGGACVLALETTSSLMKG
jgi:hypothetical protein